MDRTELDDVKSLELLLLQPETRADRSTLERLLHADFREIGASGQLWNRNAIIGDLTEHPEPSPIAVSQLDARRVTDDLILVTYRTDTPGRSALRSSWWARSDGPWQVIFHQGTPITT